MISIKQLNYVLAVERTRHFKRAAEQCNVSQSALSTAIAELESQLDIQIFERDNKKVLTTPLGEEVLARARTIKAEVDALYQLRNREKSPLSLPMTMGVIPSIGPYLLPQVLPALRKAYPDFELTIVEEQSQVLVDKLREGEIDTAILALPFDIAGLHAFEFWEEDFYLVTHREDPLSRKKSVTSNELANARLLLLKDGHCLKDHALAACRLKNSEYDTSFAGTSLHTLIQMVAGRMGITLVPAMALGSLLQNNTELAAVPLAEPGPHRRIAFITRLNYAGVSSIEVLMKLFRESLTHA